MRVRSIREANQNFSKLIAEVERGETIVITRNGRQVAEVRPVAVNRMEDPVWRAAYERMVALLDDKTGTGGPVGVITEDDKYGDAVP
jgi:prevent-host-death family protein